METLLKNIEKMFVYRSELRRSPAPSLISTDPPVFRVWDSARDDFVETVVLPVEKFTTKQYYNLDDSKKYIILTDKSLHYELRKQLLKTKTVELFSSHFFKINLLDFAPPHALYDGAVSCKRQLPKLLRSDPMSLFCHFSVGELVTVDDRICVVI